MNYEIGLFKNPRPEQCILGVALCYVTKNCSKADKDREKLIYWAEFSFMVQYSMKKEIGPYGTKIEITPNM